MANERILAVDIGAGSLRAGLVTAQGRVSAMTSIALAVDEPKPGWAELDPEVWWQAFVTASGRVLRTLSRSQRVIGICVCGLTRTQVLLDRNGRPLGNAILFRDRRASAIAGEMNGVTAFDAAARLAWIERHQPRRFARIDKVVEPKDYVSYRLSGTHSPHHAAPWQQTGVAQRIARLAGIPVFSGAMDTWASAVGAGAVRAQQAYDVAGTSEAVGLLTPQRVEAKGLITLRWTEDAYQLGGPTQAGADCARWCHDTFRVTGRLDDAIERAGRAPPRAGLPLFLPYLAGERTPVWSSDVRGAFHNLDHVSAPDDYLCSVMEGVAMAVRDILDHAHAASSTGAIELVASGGGARSDAWNRIKADVTGLPVIRSVEPETGVVGAAMAAAVGLGIYRSMGDAATHMVTRTRTFEPRRKYAALLAARAEGYRTMKEAALRIAASP